MYPKTYVIVRNSVESSFQKSILKNYEDAHLQPPLEMYHGAQKNLDLLKDIVIGK